MRRQLHVEADDVSAHLYRFCRRIFRQCCEPTAAFQYSALRGRFSFEVGQLLECRALKIGTHVSRETTDGEGMIRLLRRRVLVIPFLFEGGLLQGTENK